VRLDSRHREPNARAGRGRHRDRERGAGDHFGRAGDFVGQQLWEFCERVVRGQLRSERVRRFVGSVVYGILGDIVVLVRDVLFWSFIVGSIFVRRVLGDIERIVGDVFEQLVRGFVVWVHAMPVRHIDRGELLLELRRGS
jgi:hypothetical protein